MKERIKSVLQKLEREIRRRAILLRRRKAVQVGDTTLLVVDRINLIFFWRSSRKLSVAGAKILYSKVPLFPFNHRLLCVNYCVPPLRSKDKAFYQRMLVLGCGGGALPLWLLNEYPQVTVDVVELSQEIIAISKEYFLKKWEGSDRLIYHCIDANDYEAPAETYQFIFCDIFNEATVHPLVTGTDFAKKLHTLLSPQGILVINCGFGQEGLEKAKAVYSKIFDNIEVVKRDPRATQVLVARKRP